MYGDIKDGKYVVKLLPGPKRVAITSSVLTTFDLVETYEENGQKFQRTVPKTISKESIPEEYNAKSTLKVDIGSESTTLPPFVLKITELEKGPPMPGPSPEPGTVEHGPNPPGPK